MHANEEPVSSSWSRGAGWCVPVLRPPGKEVYGNWYENSKFKTFADILNTFIKAALKEVGDGYTVAVRATAAVPPLSWLLLHGR